jgi:hypothetical protein
MTTYVPQDSNEVLNKLYNQLEILDAHPDYNESCTIIAIVEAIEHIKFMAQRQQGAEPVAWLYEGRTKQPFPKRKEWASISETEHWPLDQWDEIKLTPLYTTPPQSNALVAAAYRKAAEICEGLVTHTCGHDEVRYQNDAFKIASAEILAAIPADAEAALREVSEKLAEAIKGAFKDEIASAKHFNVPGVADALEAFQDTVVTFAVNSVLGEGGK